MDENRNSLNGRKNPAITVQGINEALHIHFPNYNYSKTCVNNHQHIITGFSRSFRPIFSKIIPLYRATSFLGSLEWSLSQVLLYIWKTTIRTFLRRTARFYKNSAGVSGGKKPGNVESQEKSPVTQWRTVNRHPTVIWYWRISVQYLYKTTVWKIPERTACNAKNKRTKRKEPDPEVGNFCSAWNRGCLFSLERNIKCFIDKMSLNVCLMDLLFIIMDNATFHLSATLLSSYLHSRLYWILQWGLPPLKSVVKIIWLPPKQFNFANEAVRLWGESVRRWRRNVLQEVEEAVLSKLTVRKCDPGYKHLLTVLL